VEAEYLGSRSAVAPFVPAGTCETVEAGLRLRIAATGGARLADIRPGALPLYLDGAEAGPGELYRQLIGDAVAGMARPVGSANTTVRLPLPEQHGFDEQCALLPTDRRSHRGYRLLSEYFACPERFLFARIEGLDAAFGACADAQACDVVILFRRVVESLKGAVSSSNFRLFSTPAINLFEKQVDRVPLTGFEHERQVIADRTRPLGFEIYRLLDVKAHGRDGDARPVAPLYDFAGLLYDWSDALFYVTRLRPRRLSTREQRARGRSDYVGTETWLSLTAPGRPERLDDVRELSIRALVTNRELPELVRTGAASPFVAEGLPVRAIHILRPPTPPRPPMGLNDGAWRVIGHLTPNYTSFASSEDGDPSALRAHLALYGRVEDATLRRQVDGLRSIRASHVSRRAPGAGPSAFVRGQRLRITLDEAGFENARMFLFGAVLERFLGEFASINSFTECVFDTAQQGMFASWPARIGQRPTI
jgi:type VI secretion system protein ImpG